VNLNTFLSTPTAAVYDVTETEMLDTPLSSGEESESASRCGFLRTNGSGAGRCDAACTATGPA
jgi:hypothetical protein